MRLNIWVPLIVAPSIVVFCIGAASVASVASVTHLNLKKNNWQPMSIELAGADTSDHATGKQLKDAGAKMIPSESLKQAKQGQSELSTKQKKYAPAKAEPKSKLTKKAMTITKVPTKKTADITGPYLRLDEGMR